MRTLPVMMTTLALLALIAPSAQAYDDGLYFSFGVGLAHETGERGVPLTSPSTCSGELFLWSETIAAGKSCIHVPNPSGEAADAVSGYRQARYDEIVRADGGSMLGLQLRLGYNILGHASIETTLSGAGNVSPLEGSAHVGFQARWHPAEIWIPHDDRDWDVSTFGGVGYSLAGYVPQFDATVHGGGPLKSEIDGEPAFEGKGWLGMHASFGFGFDYKFSESASVGLDLKFIRTLYSTWVANFTDAYETEPIETPESWIITPTVRVTWHMWSPGS